MASMKKTVDVNAVIESGDLSPIFTWLESNIWSKGSLLNTDDLVKGATGETLNAQYFKDHLRSRYLEWNKSIEADQFIDSAFLITFSNILRLT